MSNIGLRPEELYSDSIGCHDFRDPETWQQKPEGGWRTSAAPIAVGDVELVGTDPVMVTAPAHGMQTGDNAIFASVGGTTELNGKAFKGTVVNADVFTLDETDSSEYSAYTSGGALTWNDHDSSFTVQPNDGLGAVMPAVWVKVSNNADMHSPLLVIYRKKDGTEIGRTVYTGLDSFLDRFTEFKELLLSRKDYPVEFYTYQFSTQLELRSAVTPTGPNAPIIPYVHSVTLKITDDQPYKAEGGGALETLLVRYPDVSFHLDAEFVPAG